MKIINKTNLLIIIMLCLAALVFKLFYMREGLGDTKGNCVYDEQGVTDLNNDDGIFMTGGTNDDVVEEYKQVCKNQKSQVMCERIHAPNNNGKKVINYCDWQSEG